MANYGGIEKSSSLSSDNLLNVDKYFQWDHQMMFATYFSNVIDLISISSVISPTNCNVQPYL
jgi:hypothetical protein